MYEKRLQINNKYVSLQRESKRNSKRRNYKRYRIDKMSKVIKTEGYKAQREMRKKEMGIKTVTYTDIRDIRMYMSLLALHHPQNYTENRQNAIIFLNIS